MSYSADVDLTNCDREPIHLLGHVQPFGAQLRSELPLLCAIRWVAGTPRRRLARPNHVRAAIAFRVTPLLIQ